MLGALLKVSRSFTKLTCDHIMVYVMAHLERGVQCPRGRLLGDKQPRGYLLIVLFVLASMVGMSGAEAKGHARVYDVRLWTAPDHTRLVFDLSNAVKYRLFSLHHPERMVIDMKQTTLRSSLDHLPVPDPVVAAIRHGTRKDGSLRIVVDVKSKVQPRSFLLKPMHGKPYRLVVDLYRPEPVGKSVISAREVRSSKEVVIAVDAGHGGDDPGAIGRHGLREKDVTLAVARVLVRELNSRPGIRALLIRKGDYFIPLYRRVALARKAKADLMISIHADAARNRKVTGASVYTMSEKGASDKVAQMLADKENASDAIGGIMPGEVTDPVVNHILADLIKRDSLNSAQLFAEELIRHFRHVGPIKYRQPKKARFVVLSAPEIPSVLIELDYISNPGRERLLKSRKHQKRLAMAIRKASERFLQRQGRLPEVQPRYHVVKRGESLWSIAKRYGITVSSLRDTNHIRQARHIRVGQRLRLPQS